MTRRVLVNVIEPREIGFFIGETGVPKVVPDSAGWSFVEAIDPTACLRVQDGEHLRKIRGVGRFGRRMANEMVMI